MIDPARIIDGLLYAATLGQFGVLLRTQDKRRVDEPYFNDGYGSTQLYRWTTTGLPSTDRTAITTVLVDDDRSKDERCHLTMKTLLLILSLGLAIVSCVACTGDPKAANDANFKSAIQNYLDADDHANLCLPHVDLPKNATTNQALLYAPGIEVINAPWLEQINALIAVGLISRTTSAIIMPADIFGPTRTVPVATYRQTKAGTAAARVVTAQTLLGATRVVCFSYGSMQVDGVSNFTEPANNNGEYVSTVTYTLKVKSLQPWATNPLILKTFPYERSWVEANKPLETKAKLHLTEHGWQVVAE